LQKVYLAARAALVALACLRIHEVRLHQKGYLSLVCMVSLTTAYSRDGGCSCHSHVHIYGMCVPACLLLMRRPSQLRKPLLQSPTHCRILAQALQLLPVLQSVVEARAAVTAAAEASQQPCSPALAAAASARGLVPALPAPAQLQPAKLAVWRMFHGQVRLSYQNVVLGFPTVFWGRLPVICSCEFLALPVNPYLLSPHSQAPHSSSHGLRSMP